MQTDNELRQLLKQHSLPDPNENFVLINTRYVSARDDWYIEVKFADKDLQPFGTLWYWFDGGEWVHAPLGPI